MNTDNQNTCKEIRSKLSALWEIGDEKPDQVMVFAVERHLAECDRCRGWKEEMESIASLAKAMPQFDVQESLTQNIMRSIRLAPVSRPSPAFIFVFACTFVIAIYWLYALESTNGCLAWSICLAIAFSIHTLTSSTPVPAYEGSEF
jgi:predicted anti-sigma-YlaC factor YlaD